MSDFPPIPKDLLDTSSKEYVTWMAAVWKANDERNKRITAKQKQLEDLDCIAEIEAGCYE
jgi:hypothetical protein